MNYRDFDELFSRICEIKQYVVKLSIGQRGKFRNEFFKQPFPQWRLELIWEFFWDDKTYNEIYTIFWNKNLIEKSDPLHRKDR